MNGKPTRCWIAGVLVTICATVALAQEHDPDLMPREFAFATGSAAGPDLPPGEFALGIGYANISIGGSDSLLNSEDALRFDGVYSYAPFPNVPQLRLGAALGVDLVFDNSQFVFMSNGGAVFAGSADIPLWTLEPEFRVSWQQFLGNDKRFYIEPGIGVGGVFANLNIDSEDSASGQSFDEWESAFEARVFLNVGFMVSGGLAGVQASYMRGGTLDFADNASGEIEEFYIGFFGALRF